MKKSPGLCWFSTGRHIYCQNDTLQLQFTGATHCRPPGSNAVPTQQQLLSTTVDQRWAACRLCQCQICLLEARRTSFMTSCNDASELGQYNDGSSLPLAHRCVGLRRYQCTSSYWGTASGRLQPIAAAACRQALPEAGWPRIWVAF